MKTITNRSITNGKLALRVANSIHSAGISEIFDI